MDINYDSNSSYDDIELTTTTAERLFLWSILDGVVGTLGVFGNGLVILVFFRANKSRQLLNLFIINQSLIDFTSSLVFLLIHLGPKFTLVPGNVVHLILCKVWLSEYVMWALFISSSMNLVCITLERYVATLKSTWYRNNVLKVRKRIILLAAMVWSSGFVIDAFWAYVQKVLPGGFCFPVYQSGIWKGVGGVTIFIVTYLGPLLVMGFSYSKILLKLHRQTGKIHSQSPTKNAPTGEADADAVQPAGATRRFAAVHPSKRSKNVIKTTLLVAATYAITWAPIAFNYVIYNLGGPLDFTSTWYEITKLFVYANMCANPFIYAMQYRQFQTGLRRMFCCSFARTLPDHPGASETCMD